MVFYSVHGSEDCVLLIQQFPLTDLKIQHNPYQNPHRLFCRKRQADSKTYVDMQVT